ncbi:MAG: class I SAM-dependent methyltransferase [Nostoc sp. ChiSLP02]|nr:class I SAM-dependent methyltransferase [Nostoc sp. DedSLP05]MDZ8099007.1 class I SAM-dependent methyltransferase [Nostoc sp. DedSLP01]MDZ8185817.1 class I SAM-dependent methyltransferase [Nostoc sp. ChiSLP02]
MKTFSSLNKDVDELLSLSRARQREIDKFIYFQLLSKIFKGNIRKTRHFSEWYRIPMNYVRLMELPLTIELLDLDTEQAILDISSPKLLPLYLAVSGFKNIIISDLLDYFVEDFQAFSEVFNISPKIDVFDAKNIPYNDKTFDRVFSVSVFEHIPDFGDIDAVREVARVIKPQGIFVLTLPAHKSYLEEWLKKHNFYWTGKTRDDGTIFYQRRYDEPSIQKRFGNLGFEIEDTIFIAEYPIKPPVLNENGMLLHNDFYIKKLWQLKVANKFPNAPLLPYLLYSSLSKKYHYLTRNSEDNNIRQVAIKLRRLPGN